MTHVLAVVITVDVSIMAFAAAVGLVRGGR